LASENDINRTTRFTTKRLKASVTSNLIRDYASH